METVIANPTPANGTTATPAQQEPVSSTGTAPTNGEARQSAPVEDNFTRVDPNTLPPQLKQTYENMLRDYKDKTARVSETAKTEAAKMTEAYKKKADFYDAFVQHEDLVKYYEDFRQKLTQPPANPTDPQNQEIQTVKQQIQEIQAQKVIEDFQNAKNEKGDFINGDFEKLGNIVVGEIPNQDGTKNTYSLLRAAVELASGTTPAEKLMNGYKSAKATFDAIFEEGKKMGMGRIQAKVRNSSLPPSSVNPGSSAPHRAKNALEALQFAKQGLLPPNE